MSFIQKPCMPGAGIANHMPASVGRSVRPDRPFSRVDSLAATSTRKRCWPTSTWVANQAGQVSALQAGTDEAIRATTQSGSKLAAFVF